MRNPQDVCGDVWNERVFADLAGLIGPAKAEPILARFHGDLVQRFGDLGDRDAVRRDAHAVTSMAGMLGFTGLSALAKALEIACRDGSDITASLAAFLQGRRAVTALLDGRAGPA